MLLSSADKLELKRTSPQYGRTQQLADKLDQLQKGQVGLGEGNGNIYLPVSIVYEVTTGAASIIVHNNTPFKLEVVDVIVQARGASTNGTIQIHDGTNAITDAIVCAVDTTVTRAGTIDDAYSTIAAGGTIEIVCAGDTVADTVGLVTILAVAVA